MWKAVVAGVLLASTYITYAKADGTECDTYDLTMVYSALDDEHWVFKNNPVEYPSAEMCVQNCFTFGYKNAGVNKDGQCMCTNKEGPWKMCKSSENYQVNVYKAAPKDDTYVGCYKEEVLAWKPPGNHNNHSVDSCKSICRMNKYLYACLGRGQQCKCISIHYENKHKSTLCNMTCASTPNETCGGAQHLSLYKTGLQLGEVNDVRYIGCYGEFNTTDPGVYNPGTLTLNECLTQCLYTNLGVMNEENNCFCSPGSTWAKGKENQEPLPESQCENSGEKPFYKFYFAQVAMTTLMPSSEEPTSKVASTISPETTLADVPLVPQVMGQELNSQDASAKPNDIPEVPGSKTMTPTATTSSTFSTTSTSKATTTTARTTETSSATSTTTSMTTTATSTTTTASSMATSTTTTSEDIRSPSTTNSVKPSSTTSSSTSTSMTEPISLTSLLTADLITTISTDKAMKSTTSTQSSLNVTSKTTRETTKTSAATTLSVSPSTMSSVSVTKATIQVVSSTVKPSNETNSSASNSEGVIINDTRIIIGAVVSGVLLIIIIIFIVYAVRRARRYAAGKTQGENTNNESCCFGGSRPSMVDKKYSKPVWKTNLNDYVIQNMQKRNHFKEEYKVIPTGLYSKAEVGRRPENLVSKNRFKNIIPYDENRVALHADTGHIDYINASYVKNYNGRRIFIAAQGPKDGTVIDFWRMIWQENVPVIVMLTELAETRNECANYWPTPDEGSVEYGSVKVTLRHETNYPFYRVRNFHVQKESGHRTVLQFQYTDWPDHGVPEAPSTLVNFYEDVQRSFDANVGPCVVHCSAGVGRTGTYLAIDYLLHQARAENKVDFMSCVYCLRKQRVNIVQTSTQYVFLHMVLNHMLTLEITSVPVDRFMVYFQSIRQITTDGDSKLEEQYKMLEATKLHFKKDDMTDGLSEVNRLKNRSESIVPRNHHRPGLESTYEGGTGYINAIVLDCYTKEHAFLMTQLPFQSTRVDIWCMVHDFGASVILALDCQEGDLYWPAEEDEMIAYGPFTVKCASVQEVTSYITTYKLEVKKWNEALDVTLFHLGWSTNDVGPVSDLLTLHSIVQSMEKKTNDLYPIVVQCKTGYERSGLYCVLSNAIKMLKIEKRVDIFQCVQTARTRRPQIIKSMNQYRFLHDAVKVYISKG